MRMVVAASLLLVSLSLVGCMEGQTAEGDGTSSSSTTSPAATSTTSASATPSTSSTSTTASSSSSTPPAPQSAGTISSSSSTGTGAPQPRSASNNQAPTATLVANPSTLQAGNATSFTLSGSDADGDALTWTLDFGDGATASGDVLPAILSHTYAAAGRPVVRLQVSDHWNTTARAVVLNVTAGPVQSAFSPLAASGGPLPACHQCAAAGAAGSVGFNAGENGVDSVWMELPALAEGKPYRVTSSPANDPDGEFLASCTPDAALVAPFASEGPESGLVPAGARCIVAWEFVGGAEELTITVG